MSIFPKGGNSKRAIHYVRVSDVICDVSHSRFRSDVSDLITSIQSMGLLQPIMVNAEMKLIAGRRRVAAYQALGLTEIPAIILSFSDVLAELAAIDENLIRLQLNSVEHDEALYRRKLIYEEHFPETKRAAWLNSERAKDIPSFVEDAADKLDISSRTVSFAVSRAKNASPKVKEARLKGLSSSKVNHLVSLDADTQDQVLPYIKERSLHDVISIVKSIKEKGLDQTLEEMNRVTLVTPTEFLLRDLQRVQKDLTQILKSDHFTNLSNKAPVVHQIKGVMRLMRSFLDRVKATQELTVQTQQEAIQGQASITHLLMQPGVSSQFTSP